MSNYNKLINDLDILELYGIKDNLATYLDLINNGSKKVVDALYELCEKEIEQRKKRAINACVKTANFPFYKTIEDFDFDFQPSVNPGQGFGKRRNQPREDNNHPHQNQTHDRSDPVFAFELKQKLIRHNSCGDF